MQSLFVVFQKVIPQHGLSRLVGLLANCQVGFVKNFLIKRFIKRYGVDMSEAVRSEASAYRSFNEFFTRSLKAGCRELNSPGNVIVSPCDGVICTLGTVENEQLIQAKGHEYSALELIGGDAQDMEPFRDGSFVTIYLAPKDYHRVHMPMAGRLIKTIYLPGKLFSVNRDTASTIPGLFARNERLVSIWQTDCGPMAVILVGALLVAGIDTVWSGQVCPNRHGLLVTGYQDHAPPIQLARGSEMGRFRLGSTVIILFGPGAVKLNRDLQQDSGIKLAEPIASIMDRRHNEPGRGRHEISPS